MNSRLVVVTPAGRRHYLELLAHHLLADPEVAGWHLWDNCRRESDRSYLHELARRDPRIRIVEVERPDGTNRTVNRFYRFCDEPDTFYVKMDDDVVWLRPGALRLLHETARAQRGRHLWWSPLVVNNAICTWLLKVHAGLPFTEELSAQAGDRWGWASADFSIRLHARFLDALAADGARAWRTPDFDLSLSRFSINAIGFFGDDVRGQGERFCPPDVDDEEWLSACLPSLLDRPGRIVGSALLVHFAFFTQEQDLLRAKVLDRYYALAGLPVPPYPVRRESLRRKFNRWRGRPG